MATFDSLPADQRAVLQLVLQRGQSYDDIAQLISIDRAGVRDRALAALDGLGPHTRVASERRGVITDYLLGQLPPPASDETREQLAESASERAWARVVASELAPLAAGSLPDIPVDSVRRQPVQPEAASEPSASSAPTAPGGPSAPSGPSAPTAPSAPSTASPPDRAAPPDSGRGPEPAGAPSRSRRGGVVLLGLGVLTAVVVGIVIVANNSSSSSHRSTSTTPAASTTASTTPATATTTTTTTATTAATTASTPTTPTGAQLIAQVNLVSPAGVKTPSGVAQVLRQAGSTGLVIVAQGVAANSAHDAYAVWLYNSPADSQILGFVNPGVTADGKLQTAGALPTNAAHFKHVLVTLETQAKPSGPGKVILEGALSLS